MAALALDADLEKVGGGIERADASGELSGGKAGAVVDAKDRLHREAFEQAVADHRARAALGMAVGAAIAERFFGGLKDQMDRAIEIARRGQMLGGAEQHRGVAVMAAGVHHARIGRAVIRCARLGHWQRVDIGADADRAVRLSSPERCDDAGAADAGLDFLDPEFAQQVDDEGAGAMLVESELGMLVDMAAPAGHVGFEMGEIDRHGVVPHGRTCPGS